MDKSLAHTKWMCKYHIIFTPKFRRKVIYNRYKQSVKEVIIALCNYKGVEIIEGHLMPDSYIYVSFNTFEDKRSIIYGIFKRKKCINDI